MKFNLPEDREFTTRELADALIPALINLHTRVLDLAKRMQKLEDQVAEIDKHTPRLIGSTPPAPPIVPGPDTPPGNPWPRPWWVTRGEGIKP